MTDPTFLGQAGHDAAYGWMVDAACAKHPDPELWFPGPSAPRAEIATAINICVLDCPVTAECLAYAQADLRLEGIWGGTTHRDRRGTKRGNR